GSRSDWIRNIRRDPNVRITSAGWVVPATAQIVEDDAANRALISANLFFPPAPFTLLNFLHRTLLRPLWLPFMRWWVSGRPVVVRGWGARRRPGRRLSPAPRGPPLTRVTCPSGAHR